MKTPIIILLMLIFSTTFGASQKKYDRMYKRWEIQLVRASALVSQSLRRYFYQSYDLYVRFFGGTCSKKERKKVRKSLRWYRNIMLSLGAIYGIKWKVDAITQEFTSAKIADLIVDRLDNPTPDQLRVEAAVERRMVRNMYKKIETLQHKVQPMVTRFILTPLDEVGRVAYAYLEHPVRRITNRQKPST